MYIRISIHAYGNSYKYIQLHVDQRRDAICLVQTLKIRPAQLSCLSGSAGRAVCLERRTSRVRVPPEPALHFLSLGKKKSCLRASLLAFALSHVHVHSPFSCVSCTTLSVYTRSLQGKATIPESSCFSHGKIHASYMHLRWDLNPQHTAYHAVALATELSRWPSWAG